MLKKSIVKESKKEVQKNRQNAILKSGFEKRCGCHAILIFFHFELKKIKLFHSIKGDNVLFYVYNKLIIK